MKYIILKEGELTGHAHKAVAEDVKLNGKKLKVLKPTKIIHEEHDTVAVPKKDFTIGDVVEYDPIGEEIRRVAD